MYRHTQFGWVIAISMIGALAVVAGVTAVLPARESFPALIVLPILVVVLILFISLTVSVESELISLSFGPGLIRKTFRLAEVKSVKPVRNRWIYGWGIHLTPHGWLFNVSGFDAVELEMTNGKRFRIGTDEPDRLCEFIRTRLGTA